MMRGIKRKSETGGNNQQVISQWFKRSRLTTEPENSDKLTLISEVQPENSVRLVSTKNFVNNDQVSEKIVPRNLGKNSENQDPVFKHICTIMVDIMFGV